MRKPSKTILFFGTEEFSLASLDALIKAGFSIGAVITKPDSQKGRGRKITPPSVKTLALRHGIEVWQPKKINEIVDKVSQFPDPVGVLVSFGKIVPQSIIDLFEPGIINVHPSLLPIYRGPSPIESAIKNGDSNTGISIMKLDAKMDAGPVYTQTLVALNGTENRPRLYEKLADLGARELVANLPGIVSGEIEAVPQDDNSAVYCHLLSKDATDVDPSDHRADYVERIIRAHIGYPKTRLPFYGDHPIITSAHVCDSPGKDTIECAQRTFLQIDSLIGKSGKAITAQEYLRGLHL